MEIRKGIVYTLIAMILVSSFLTSYYALFKSYEYTFDPSSYVVRGYQLGETLEVFKADFKRAMMISGRRAVVEIVREETDEGKYLSDIEDTIVDYAYKGTKGLMKNATLSDWLEAFRNLSLSYKINASFDLLNTSLSFYPVYSPERLLSLNYTIFMSIFLKDEIFGSYYLVNETFSMPLKFDDLEDPFLSLESAGYVRQVYKLCDVKIANVGSHDYYWGYAYKSYDSDLTGVSGKGRLILVTDTLLGKTGYNGFRGYILEDYYFDPTLSNYVSNVTSEISDKINAESLVVVSDDEIWITNHYEDYKNASCYFRWNKGINIIKRLEGNKTYDSIYGIATFIPTSSLPDYLVYSSDPQVIDSEYFS